MRSASVWLSLLALVLAALTGLVLWQSVQVASLSSVQEHLDALRPLGSVIRCSALALVAFGGSLLLYLRYRCGRIDVHALKRQQVRYWRVIAWLVAIEVLLGQQLLRYFLTALSSGGP